MAVAGALSAVSLVLMVTGLGLIPLPFVSLTIMHVPVIIGAVLEGPIVGLFCGALFGVFTLIRAAVAATTEADMAFINPLISVLPRLFIGPAAYFVYTLVRGRKKEEAADVKAEKKWAFRETLASAAAGVAGSLTNTVLVLGALAVSKIIPWMVLITIAATNGLFEAAFAGILCAAVVTAWKRIPRTGKSKLSRISEN